MNELGDETKDVKFSTYEVMTSYLSLLIAKYDSSTKILKRFNIPLNVRGELQHLVIFILEIVWLFYRWRWMKICNIIQVI